MKMTYFKWSLTRFIRLLIRILFIGPVILLTVIPAYIYDLMQNIDYKLSKWWIDEGCPERHGGTGAYGRERGGAKLHGVVFD